jgi:hypothetical protein
VASFSNCRPRTIGCLPILHTIILEHVNDILALRESNHACGAVTKVPVRSLGEPLNGAICSTLDVEHPARSNSMRPMGASQGARCHSPCMQQSPAGMLPPTPLLRAHHRLLEGSAHCRLTRCCKDLLSCRAAKVCCPAEKACSCPSSISISTQSGCPLPPGLTHGPYLVRNFQLSGDILTLPGKTPCQSVQMRVKVRERLLVEVAHHEG